MDGVVGGMAGIIPIALMGGITLGITQEALRIPGRIQAERESYRPSPRRKRGVKKNDIWQDLFGMPPEGLY